MQKHFRERSPFQRVKTLEVRLIVAFLELFSVLEKADHGTASIGVSP